MATEALEIRMARLEGAYAQINERLGSVELEIRGLRSDLKIEIGTIRSEINTEIGSIRSEIGTLRSQLSSEMKTQFYWVLTFIMGAILIPILRDLVVVR